MGQVSNEIAVYQLALALEEIDSAYPDVGIPPGFASFVYEAIGKLRLKSSDVDIKVVLNWRERNG